MIELGEPTGKSTPIYKYFSLESFLYFFEYKRVLFTSVENWPDDSEGRLFEFLKRVFPEDPNSKKQLNEFLGCCWTLQNEDERLFDSEEELCLANEDLKKFGSDAMWQAYCGNGGV